MNFSGYFKPELDAAKQAEPCFALIVHLLNCLLLNEFISFRKSYLILRIVICGDCAACYVVLFLFSAIVHLKLLNFILSLSVPIIKLRRKRKKIKNLWCRELLQLSTIPIYAINSFYFFAYNYKLYYLFQFPYCQQVSSFSINKANNGGEEDFRLMISLMLRPLLATSFLGIKP